MNFGKWFFSPWHFLNSLFWVSRVIRGDNLSVCSVCILINRSFVTVSLSSPSSGNSPGTPPSASPPQGQSLWRPSPATLPRSSPDRIWQQEEYLNNFQAEPIMSNLLQWPIFLKDIYDSLKLTLYSEHALHCFALLKYEDTLEHCSRFILSSQL